MADQRLIPESIRDTSTLALNEVIDRMGTLDITPLLIYLVDYVDSSALPHLIEQFHVAGNEGAALAENDTNRRSLVKGAIAMHRMKGTPAGVAKSIKDAGFGDVEIIERPGEVIRNGSVQRGGLYTHGTNAGDWVNYHIVLQRPITNDQALLIRALCKEFAPRRSKLLNLVFTEAACRHNGTIKRDGSYNRGIVQ
jgi:hypothetical protein